MKDFVLQLVGEGLGMSLLAYPITWYAMRESIGRRKMWQTKGAMLATVVLMPLVGLLHSLTQESYLAPFVALLGPLLLCAAILHWAYGRRSAGPPGGAASPHRRLAKLQRLVLVVFFACLGFALVWVFLWWDGGVAHRAEAVIYEFFWWDEYYSHSSTPFIVSAAARAASLSLGALLFYRPVVKIAKWVNNGE